MSFLMSPEADGERERQELASWQWERNCLEGEESGGVSASAPP